LKYVSYLLRKQFCKRAVLAEIQFALQINLLATERLLVQWAAHEMYLGIIISAFLVSVSPFYMSMVTV
jgi:hypothetical protein